MGQRYENDASGEWLVVLWDESAGWTFLPPTRHQPTPTLPISAILSQNPLISLYLRPDQTLKKLSNDGPRDR